MTANKPRSLHYEAALRVAERLRGMYRHKQFIVRENGNRTEIDVYPQRDKDTERAPYSRIVVKAYNLIALCGNFDARFRENSGHFSMTVDRMLWTEGNLRSQHSSLRALVKTHEGRIRALPSMDGLDLRFELVGLDGVGAGPELHIFAQGTQKPIIKIAYNTYANRTHRDYRYTLQMGSTFDTCVAFADVLAALSNPLFYADVERLTQVIERHSNPSVVEVLGLSDTRERTFVLDAASLPEFTPLLLAIGCSAIEVHTVQLVTKLNIPFVGIADWTKSTALGSIFETTQEVAYVRFTAYPGKPGTGPAWVMLNKALRVDAHKPK